jgi:hypothetical protein
MSVLNPTLNFAASHKRLELNRGGTMGGNKEFYSVKLSPIRIKKFYGKGNISDA